MGPRSILSQRNQCTIDSEPPQGTGYWCCISEPVINMVSSFKQKDFLILTLMGFFRRNIYGLIHWLSDFWKHWDSIGLGAGLLCTFRQKKQRWCHYGMAEFLGENGLIIFNLAWSSIKCIAARPSLIISLWSLWLLNIIKSLFQCHSCVNHRKKMLYNFFTMWIWLSKHWLFSRWPMNISGKINEVCMQIPVCVL